MTRKPGQGRKVHYVADTGASLTGCRRHVDSADVRRITSDPGSVTCGGCREALGLDTTVAIIRATAATLRYVGGWIADPSDAHALTDAADRLDHYDGDLSDATACPVCEEVRCDDDCPLHPVRAALGLWSSP